MQYSVKDKDGNQYGPVDLITLKKWVQEGRVLPDTVVTDNLSSVSLVASQMPELGGVQQVNPYANTPAPPSSFSQYPRTDGGIRKTRLWAILFWLGLGVLAASFSKYGGLIISGWNIFDAFKAKSDKDPNGGLCIGVAVGGFLLILLWTILKNQAAPNS